MYRYREIYGYIKKEKIEYKNYDKKKFFL
jgi:hypothetical protein